MSDYRAEWQEYRRRRKVYSVVLWGFLPFGGFAAVSEFSPIAARSKLALSLVLAYLALYFYAAVRVTGEELIRFGREVRRLAEDPVQRQLDEGRREWVLGFKFV